MSSFEKPWFTYKAIEWLDQNIKPDWNIFEWGAGGSTVYFKERSSNVISIEHNMKYADNATYVINVESPSYYSAIEQFGIFDLVSIDGRNRVECARRAVNHAKRILLDNSERERYSEVFEILEDWEKLNFHGEGRGGKVWRTTIWLRHE